MAHTRSTVNLLSESFAHPRVSRKSSEGGGQSLTYLIFDLAGYCFALN